MRKLPVLLPRHIIRWWRDSRSVVGREVAINSFLAITDPCVACATAFDAEVAGAEGTRRFVLECHGYRLNPGEWRQQQRLKMKRHELEYGGDRTKMPIWDRLESKMWYVRPRFLP